MPLKVCEEVRSGQKSYHVVSLISVNGGTKMGLRRGNDEGPIISVQSTYGAVTVPSRPIVHVTGHTRVSEQQTFVTGHIGL